MSKYNSGTLYAAFSTVCRLVSRGEVVAFSKLEGLNTVSSGLFKEAITHSFTKDGIDLKRLFIWDEDGKHLHLNTSIPAEYRLDPTLGERIGDAMSFVYKAKYNASKEAESPADAPVDSVETKIAEIDAQIANLNEQREAILRFKAAQERLKLICEASEMSEEELFSLIKYVRRGL